jgi:hypothetical protein
VTEWREFLDRADHRASAAAAASELCGAGQRSASFSQFDSWKIMYYIDLYG